MFPEHHFNRRENSTRLEQESTGNITLHFWFLLLEEILFVESFRTMVEYLKTLPCESAIDFSGLNDKLLDNKIFLTFHFYVLISSIQN